MSVTDTLRRAAQEMRADYPEREWDRDEHAFAFHHAVADWLEAIAEARAVIDGLATLRRKSPGRGADLFLEMEGHALAVAAAYLSQEATP